jgi:hypothetical protein
VCFSLKLGLGEGAGLGVGFKGLEVSSGVDEFVVAAGRLFYVHFSFYILWRRPAAVVGFLRASTYIL